MRPQDLKEGVYYRLADSPSYGYAKFLKIIPAKTGVNTKTYKIAQCEHSVRKNDRMVFIRHFRPCDMIKDD